MNIKANPIFYKRISPRNFKNIEVGEEDLLTLFEASRWAASSFNEQPWIFIYASKANPAVYEKLFSCLSDNNKKWASEAPVLMLTIVKTYFEKNDSPNRHAMHDLGLAMGNMTTQASILDIAVHQMAGFDRNQVRAEFDIPERFEPATMVAIGYSDEKKDNRSRRPIEEFVFDNLENLKEQFQTKTTVNHENT